ncbi:MAG TPA: ATP-binding cassette domain-containing protein, partial [Roseiarcus sp.]|nr:ATP-binding cassette domain-containing protein [Roseiarcus sp.]
MDAAAGQGSNAATPLLAVRGITKRFGNFTANDHIDLDLVAGEVHALLGENGAGKSTLVKMLYGILAPTEGEILWQGRPIHLPNPNAARALGIGMVFQHFSLFENLTVAENIALVMPPADRLDDVPAKIAEISRAYGMGLEPSRPVWTLSAGERQRIEIARCLLQDPKVLILDEPTSVLTPQEAEKLFETLERLKGEGKALLYISHHLEEVQRLCDRATILRLGKLVGACNPRAETPRSLAALMVGSEIKEVKPAGAHALGKDRLVVSNLSLPSPELHGVALKNVSAAIKGGEIFGVAGVAGNGQSELFAALSGETLANDPQAIVIDGEAVGARGIGA